MPFFTSSLLFVIDNGPLPVPVDNGPRPSSTMALRPMVLRPPAHWLTTQRPWLIVVAVDLSLLVTVVVVVVVVVVVIDDGTMAGCVVL
jgi:hypothetical protein